MMSWVREEVGWLGIQAEKLQELIKVNDEKESGGLWIEEDRLVRAELKNKLDESLRGDEIA